VINEEIPAKVSADKACHSAKKCCDRRNARVELDQALQRVLPGLRAGLPESFKQRSDNPSFRKWLASAIFPATYAARV